jgi:hypothetical protein
MNRKVPPALIWLPPVYSRPAEWTPVRIGGLDGRCFEPRGRQRQRRRDAGGIGGRLAIYLLNAQRRHRDVFQLQLQSQLLVHGIEDRDTVTAFGFQHAAGRHSRSKSHEPSRLVKSTTS